LLITFCISNWTAFLFFYIHRLCSAHQRKKSKNVSEQEKTLLPFWV